jgi:hypothetical protein
MHHVSGFVSALVARPSNEGHWSSYFLREAPAFVERFGLRGAFAVGRAALAGLAVFAGLAGAAGLAAFAGFLGFVSGGAALAAAARGAAFGADVSWYIRTRSKPSTDGRYVQISLTAARLASHSRRAAS